MNLSLRTQTSLDWLIHSLSFFKKHFLVIFGLGLVAAFGRAIQLRAFGEITALSHFLLEILVESARVLIFFYTLGLTNFKTGIGRFIHLLINSGSRKQNWNLAVRKIRKQWSSILLNLVAFMIIAWAINYLIDYAAYQTCMYYKLKEGKIISDTTSEWALILFFKNISVIPFTLIFNALFLLWITNKLNSNVSISS